MSRRISGWWYALPVGLAVVSVLVGGVLVGIQLGGAVRTVTARLDEIDDINRIGLHVTLQAGEPRAIAAGTVDGVRPLPGSVRCRVTPEDGQPAPMVQGVAPGSRDDLRLEVNDRFWWPVYRVEAVVTGAVLVECQSDTAGTAFVLGPWFQASDFAGYGVAGAVALAVAAFGLLLATAAAVVIVVLQLTHRRPSPSAPAG